MRSQAGRRVALDAGLGDEDRPAVAGIGLEQDPTERPVERMVPAIGGPPWIHWLLW